MVVGEVLFYVFLPLKFTEEVETSTLFLIPENARGGWVETSTTLILQHCFKPRGVRMSMLGQSRAYLQGLLKHLLRVLTAHLQHFFVGVHHAGQQVGRAMALVVQLLTELLQPRVLRQLAFHQDSADSSRMYLWWSFIIGRSCHKYHFCHDKHVFVMSNMCFVMTNMFVATKVWLLRQKFCCDKIVFHNKYLLQQIFCHDKHTFVVTRVTFCRNDHVSVVTNTCLLQQNFCRDKNTCGSSRQ